MTVNLAPRAVDLESPRRSLPGDSQNITTRPHTWRPAAALGALLTAVKVGLAVIAILVIFPAALAAQGAVAR